MSQFRVYVSQLTFSLNSEFTSRSSDFFLAVLSFFSLSIYIYIYIYILYIYRNSEFIYCKSLSLNSELIFHNSDFFLTILFLYLTVLTFLSLNSQLSHPNTHTTKDNRSAQDCRHRRINRETNEGNEGDTGGATETMIS